MTNEQIAEGNKLIGDFIGKKFNCSMNYMYDNSWDWLMPVIDKISRIGAKDDSLITNKEDTYYPRTFGMFDKKGRPMFRFNYHPLFTADTLIEAAWLAVVDFVKWQSTIDPKQHENLK